MFNLTKIIDSRTALKTSLPKTLSRLVLQGRTDLEEIYLPFLLIEQYKMIYFFLEFSIKEEILNVMPVHNLTKTGKEQE